ncbi:MAG TPA: FAD binding domain-containing protein [Pyrinomonadaceae bacterium]|jgi:xanthine dehydrogenase small subunit|nr:FAD binding domain-containing protein [Pyrinomonadaceae bacterium]
MIKFILNEQTTETDLPPGMTVLDFVRYRKDLKGTKIGCREGDCGACTILVGELDHDKVNYRSMTSCLMPLANAYGKHIVTVEGINKPDGSLTNVQQAMVDESGTQCGFCTVGFVMSLTGFCIDDAPKTCQAAVSSVDGNICRCTGYKSIERAACAISERLAVGSGQWAEDSGQSGVQGNLNFAIENDIVPSYFSGIKDKLIDLKNGADCPPSAAHRQLIAGGTDLYVQRPEEMAETSGNYVFDNSDLRRITQNETHVEVGASAVVTDLMVSLVFVRLFPDLYKHLKLVSSTPIRNMATLAGNFVNASPIGDMTAWFLALDAEIELSAGDSSRWMHLKDLYLGYKQLAKTEDEFITNIRFKKDFTHFNFEKVCKRTYLDIASVNTAISLRVEGDIISDAHVSAGGVAPTPLYLTKTSEYLRGKEINEMTIAEAAKIIQTEISPISDVRGSEAYKRLLLRQLFTAHFVELFNM